MFPINRAQLEGVGLRLLTTSLNDVKPLVANLDGKDCKTEMRLLGDLVTVAFCDARKAQHISEKVFNEAVAVFMWQLTLTTADLKKFKKLKIIVQIGSGVGNIDVKAAGQLGIAVSICNSAGVEEVADATLCMILDLYRGTHWLANMVKDGKTFMGPDQLNTEMTQKGTICCLPIRGSTLGIVGLGHIGTAVALRAKALGFKVIVYDPYLSDGFEVSMGVTRVSELRDLLSVSDCVSLHCSLNPDSYYLINESTIKQMKPGAFLINTAERELVDEVALAFALRSGHIRSAAMDIDLKGPNNVLKGPLKGVPNLICTPHTAYFSDTSGVELRAMAASEIRRALVGKIPDSLKHCVNKEYLRVGATSSSKPGIPASRGGGSRVEAVEGAAAVRPTTNSNSTSNEYGLQSSSIWDLISTFLPQTD